MNNFMDIVEKLKELDDDFNFDYIIDDMKINIYLHVFKKYNDENIEILKIIFRSRKIIDKKDYCQKIYLNTHFEIKNEFEKMKYFFENLKNMKYDNEHNCFLLPNHKLFDKINIKNELINLIDDAENKCTVCFSYNLSLTICKHCICYKCREKIDNNKCPICRNKTLEYYDDEDDSDNSDEDDD